MEGTNVNKCQHLQNVTDVVAFCEQKQNEQHATYPNAKRDVICYFHLVKPEYVNRRASWDCKKLDGCHSMHSMVFVSHRYYTLLNVRHLACFCSECMDDNSNFCKTQTHVKPQQLLKLEPFNVSHVHNFDLHLVLIYVHTCLIAC
jgi:hypothetical protein